MQVKRAPGAIARDDEDARTAVPGRTAAAFTLAGCVILLLTAILPWGEKAIFGLSLTTVKGGDARIVLAVLAVASASLAVAVLLRRQPTAGVAALLLGLALAQVGAGIWFGVVVVEEIRVAHPQLVFVSAIGTGAYTAVLGALSNLVGAILAWTRRGVAQASTAPAFSGDDTAHADGDTEARLR